MKLLLPTLIFFSCLKVFAQDTTNTDNPIIIDKLINNISTGIFTTSIVEKNAFQLDIDLVYRYENFGFRDASLPELKVRYGILKGLEIRGGLRIGYHYQSFHFGTPNEIHEPLLSFIPKSYHEVFSDYLTIGAKANILTYNGNKGKISLLAESYLPVFRSEKARGLYSLPTFTFINSDKLNNWLAYNFNAGTILNYTYRSDRQTEKFIALYNLSITPVFTLSEPLNLFIGFRKIMYPPHSYGYFDFHTGFLYTVNPNLQIRAAGTMEKAPKYNYSGYQANLGIAWQPNF